MKFTLALIAVAATILPALAAPTAEAEAQLEKRDNTVYVCTGEYVVYSQLESMYAAA